MGETRFKAEDEFAKNPDLKREDLAELRHWLRTQENIPLISEEDLILFLHSCYYDVGKTKDCIKVYYNIRSKSPELYTKRDLQLPQNKKLLPVLNFVEMPVKDPNGYHIVFHSLKQHEPWKYTFADALKIYLMTIEICIRHEGPSPGLVLLFDMAGVKLGHITRISLSLTRRFLVLVQEGLPVRLKAIHIVNVISVIDHIMTLIKPFLSKELLKLIHFHKGNNESVFEYLPKKCLPKDFGGELPTIAELDGNYMSTFQEFQEYFRKDDESQMAEKGNSHRRGDALEDVPESAFRSLAID